MITNKHIGKIVGTAMAVAVLACLLAMAFPRQMAAVFGEGAVAMQYQSELFDTSRILQVDIQMEEGKWEEMLANAMAEEYVSCNVEINGQTLYNVGIRPKGNTSLSAIASDPETDRYSMKLEFDHYVDGQTCLGLDKLILNNNYADATSRKEAIVYDMYQYLGADASLYNYAQVSVNGEYWGVYLALEAVEDSFMLRNFGAEDGELYKPEGMELGGVPGMGNAPEPGGDPGVGEVPEPGGSPGMGEAPERGGGPGMGNASERGGGPGIGEAPEPGGVPGMGNAPEPGGVPGMGDFPGRNGLDREGSAREDRFSMKNNNGADLNYTDDDLDSYATIWEGEITNTQKEDHRRVVTALEYISQGQEPDRYLDIDNVLKYMAVHTFAVNLDSLSGNMAHNYYLYEYNGKLNIIPWDYNLAFGGMNAGGGRSMMQDSATSMVNDAIDTPFQGTDFFDALLENEEYRSQYHAYLQDLVEGYVYGGRFQETYDHISSQINALVETDPTAFYTYEEYRAATEMLYQVVLLRAESVRGQLEGTVPSTDAGQREDASSLVDASAIDVEVMGVFMGAGR